MARPRRPTRSWRRWPAPRTRGPQTILLTHPHPDHAGGLEALRAAWDPAILCHREEVGFVTGEADYRRLAPRGFGFSIGRHFMRRSTWVLPVARDLERAQAVEGLGNARRSRTRNWRTNSA